tara:strand:+ start:13252 stop:13743 length:492 start_codon:yes stop_codon:yes gene_type:complete
VGGETPRPTFIYNERLNYMTKKFVYLCGPMEGCTDSEIDSWRNLASQEFSYRERDIVGITPNRCEPDRNDWHQATKEIFNKNMMDCKRCDLLLAYMPKEITQGRGNYGTTTELAWFIMMQKPIVLVTDDPGIINHPVMMHGCGWIVDNLEEGLDIVVDLLGVY